MEKRETELKLASTPAKECDTPEKQRAYNEIASEVTQQALLSKYREEVHGPRLELWQVFNSYLKSINPSSIESAVFQGKQPSFHHKSLPVATWKFESTSLDTLLRTETTVIGLEVYDEALQQASDQPSKNLTAHLLGKYAKRYLTSVEEYQKQRIDGINAYTIDSTSYDLNDNPVKTVHFNGQDATYGGGYDTFITLSQIREAHITHTTGDKHLGGIYHRTRPDAFIGTFSAPIETPVELSKKYRPRFVPGKQIVSADDTYNNYAYLFENTPCTIVYGEVDIEADGLFKYKGNETLAYMQAEALFNQIEQSALTEPSPND